MRKAMRRLISWATRFTPGVFYYAKGWPSKLNDAWFEVPLHDGREHTAMSRSAIAMACAASEFLKEPGDTMTSEMAGVSNGGVDCGHFRVTVTRLTEKEAAI